jgi:hypothetical protein
MYAFHVERSRDAFYKPGPFRGARATEMNQV